MRIALSTATVFALVLSLCGGPAFAQSVPTGCRLEAVAGNARHILHCPNGLTVTAEAGARYSLIDSNADSRPDAVSLRDKAVLVDVDAKLIKNGFRVITPQAIAAVRGTQWAVDVKDGVTSVFVLRGRVAVRRPQAAGDVFLDPGEGVDVSVGRTPLTVKRWPPARAAALLARLGQ